MFSHEHLRQRLDLSDVKIPDWDEPYDEDGEFDAFEILELLPNAIPVDELRTYRAQNPKEEIIALGFGRGAFKVPLRAICEELGLIHYEDAFDILDDIQTPEDDMDGRKRNVELIRYFLKRKSKFVLFLPQTGLFTYDLDEHGQPNLENYTRMEADILFQLLFKDTDYSDQILFVRNLY